MMKACCGRMHGTADDAKCWCQCQPRACQDVCHVFRSEVPPGTREDAEVRAPLPVVRDRLYAVDLAGLSRPRGAPQRERNQVDAFRDFRCAAAVASKCQRQHACQQAAVIPIYCISSLHDQCHALCYSKLLPTVCGTSAS